MKIQYRKQQFQIDAVNSIVDVFEGQDWTSNQQFISEVTSNLSIEDFLSNKNSIVDLDAGYANAPIQLTNDQLLSNINEIQKNNGIEVSNTLSNNLGIVDLDIEMETGTGKTFVYTKTIFELNKKYGFNKFIIVVPSVAIREGIRKSLESTENYFMKKYGKKIRSSIYNSKQLGDVASFSNSNSIQVLIINTQAFNSAASTRIIYRKIDRFQSRSPMDVIADNRPILILDEPQKMTGKQTKKTLQNFNPLFSINFSATHKERHNLVYVLDAVDAYNNQIVKRIEVQGITSKNFTGSEQYIYVEEIVISPNNPPKAKLEFERNFKTKGISRYTRNLAVGEDLYTLSNGLEQYKNGFVIAEINPIHGYIRFVNDIQLNIGQISGDKSDIDLRRIQIRQTIKAHLEKEKEHFYLGIKVLSLFFIDEVKKYRKYDKNGNKLNGEYGIIFEEEYDNLVRDYIKEDSKFSDYLKSIKTSKTHEGYFSIDKSTGNFIDSKIKANQTESDDITAYELILKRKERLLSFEEQTRFIFSHSALREGWDNPNVFQICTLRNTQSIVQKHQEVGRGLRLAVNQLGERVDKNLVGDRVHDINILTIIANEAYEEFVSKLQTEISENTYSRDLKLQPNFFEGKQLKNKNNEKYVLDKNDSLKLYKYLISNFYLDDNDYLSDKYFEDKKDNVLSTLPNELLSFTYELHNLITKSKPSSTFENMVKNVNQSKIIENKLNENFYKREFQNLWNIINKKYAYTVSFDSTELIDKSVQKINADLKISRTLYTITKSIQKKNLDHVDYKEKDVFGEKTTDYEIVNNEIASNISYDFVGKIANETNLTRITISTILSKINIDKFNLLRNSPEEFISNVSKIIKDELSSLIIEHIQYHETEKTFDIDIFTESKRSMDYLNAIKSKKHIKNFVFTDGTSKMSVEKKFALELDEASQVSVFAKLPRGFYIPTPVGNYTPDWAITFNKGSVRHIYFIAETKGSMDSLQINDLEKQKIACADKLFKNISNKDIKYGKVTSFEKLMELFG